MGLLGYWELGCYGIPGGSCGVSRRFLYDPSWLLVWYLVELPQLVSAKRNTQTSVMKHV
ncbi:hypothetical protein PDJAM_G00207420, partial [Pangasius djambal]|nr:hypothetical protein [Pangasius djambal]